MSIESFDVKIDEYGFAMLPKNDTRPIPSKTETTIKPDVETIINPFNNSGRQRFIDDLAL